MKIAFLGDVALFGRNTCRNSVIGQKLNDVSKFLNGFDIVVANLEAPFTTSNTVIGGKSAYIKSDPTDIEILKMLNISVVNLANNHIFDFGLNGYESTIDSLEKSNIRHFGVENNVVNIEKDEERLCFAGVCSFTTNPKGVIGQPNGIIDSYNLDIVLKRMKESREKGYFNVLSVHSGLEHVNYPSLEDVDAARLLSQDGPFIYYGHHPHVIQGVEELGGSLIAYSLGNFLFDDVYTSKSQKPLVSLSENNRLGMILTVEILDGGIVNSEQVLVYNDDNNLRILDREADSQFYDLLCKYSSKLQFERDVYEKERQALLDRHLDSRKAMRNIPWYLKRLNFDTLRMIRSAKVNAKLQRENITIYLSKRT